MTTFLLEEKQMKKYGIIILVTLLFLAAGTASAGARPKLGFKAGWSFADQDWEYSNILGKVDRAHRSGLAFGLFMDLPLTPVVQFRPEALYVQKGSQVEVVHMTEAGVPAGTLTFKDRIDYLSLVATVKFKKPAGPVGVYVLGGPRLDLKVSTSSDDESPAMEAVLDSYKSTVTGLTIGLGVERSFGAIGPVVVEARYDHDFSEAARHVGEEATLTIDNKGFLFLVGMAW